MEIELEEKNIVAKLGPDYGGLGWSRTWNHLEEETRSFKEDLTQLINANSIENGSDTPDFLLTKYLMGCLSNYESVVQERESWHSCKG